MIAQTPNRLDSLLRCGGSACDFEELGPRFGIVAFGECADYLVPNVLSFVGVENSNQLVERGGVVQFPEVTNCILSDRQVVPSAGDFQNFGAAACCATFNQRPQNLNANFFGLISVVNFDQFVCDLIAVLVAQTLDCSETKFLIGIVACDVEEKWNHSRTTVRAEHGECCCLETLALRWCASFDRFRHECDGAFLVCLKETLQREYLDLTVLFDELLVHQGLLTEYDQQR